MSDIYIDADGCPVIEETLQAGEDFGFPVILVCDTSHVFPYEHVVILMADKGRDSTDFLLLSHVKKGDIVVTQDYGLAAPLYNGKHQSPSHNASCRQCGA